MLCGAVAEWEDAGDLKSSVREDVWVRIPPALFGAAVDYLIARRETTVKIILKEHVPNLGERGDVADVADGYARNYLIPQGMAVIATAGSVKDFEHRQEVQARKHERMKKRAETLARHLTAQTLTFEVKTGETGQLYGSITNADIAEALKEQAGVEIDRRDIPLTEPIRQVGEHYVPVRLMEEVEPQVRVMVKPEEGELPASTEPDEEQAA